MVRVAGHHGRWTSPSRETQATNMNLPAPQFRRPGARQRQARRWLGCRWLSRVSARRSNAKSFIARRTPARAGRLCIRRSSPPAGEVRSARRRAAGVAVRPGRLRLAVAQLKVLQGGQARLDAGVLCFFRPARRIKLTCVVEIDLRRVPGTQHGGVRQPPFKVDVGREGEGVECLAGPRS
jgi:hypothetical protein